MTGTCQHCGGDVLLEVRFPEAGFEKGLNLYAECEGCGRAARDRGVESMSPDW